jgi:hypothetical protein
MEKKHRQAEAEEEKKLPGIIFLTCQQRTNEMLP